MKHHVCCICSQIRGDAANDLLEQLIGSHGYVRRVALESEAFAVIPSVGPLVSGHVLLCPKTHFKSFAQIPSTLEAEFHDMKQRLYSLLRETYRQPVHYFEHGSSKKAEQPSCTVEHAHVHFLPTNVEIWPVIENQFQWHPVEKSMRLLTELVGEMEYLWYESPEGLSVVTTGVEGTFESQYLRKIFARALGQLDEWNWRDYPKVPLIRETLSRISQLVTSN